MTKDITDYIRTIPDFPHKGIMFRDVTTLFGNAEGFKLAVSQMVEQCKDMNIDTIAGLEARGFIIGGAVAERLGVGFLPVRKAGKLPGKTISEDYTLEYGTATIEVHDDAIEAGARVLLIDDLIATGGTAAAGIKLIERLGGEVIHAAFIIDLPDLGGAQVIRDLGVPVTSLCAFEGD
ncbi:adenine phosphoribosyltransferase [Amylibacter sp. IMCC11727]|uniref:adenine phosphoribosyltransferase n=1 Tax=Amylibacter sp. IMCC11727 TaxID=3039851 RepID=UPI00244E078D|nr:adenine phosphoribosyltransferase [Amylibacter sp. IMCC11727]WGI21076.1 adenine phosphoribosyltransferase [Amylibacter sp. IMCC11727]